MRLQHKKSLNILVETIIAFLIRGLTKTQGGINAQEDFFIF